MIQMYDAVRMLQGDVMYGDFSIHVSGHRSLVFFPLQKILAAFLAIERHDRVFGPQPCLSPPRAFVSCYKRLVRLPGFRNLYVSRLSLDRC